jgi:hypothetical protein
VPTYDVDALVSSLRAAGLVKPDVPDSALVAAFEKARAEDGYRYDRELTFNTRHERIRVFLAPYLTAKGTKWAVPLASIGPEDDNVA